MPQDHSCLYLKRMHHERGFTLIEIIVVVLIIGIIVSFATLSISGRSQQDRLNNEVRRLTELMRLASDEAVLLGLEIGMRSKAKGSAYEFMVIGEEGSWQTYQQVDSPLRPRSLPDGMQMEVVVEDFEPPAADEEEALPAMLFLSSGELTPFEIRLTAQDAEYDWLIEGDLTGKIEARQPDEGERR